MKDSDIVLNTLSKAQLDFIKSELGVTKDAIKGMDSDAINELCDKICDIEVEETIKADDERNGEYSEREKMVESIVTAIGNELYRLED